MNVCNKLERLSLALVSSLINCIWGKARRMPLSEAPEMSFTWVGSGRTHKYLTKLEMLAKDKYSSLFRTFVNYGRKKFCNFRPCTEVNKLATSLNLAGTNVFKP